MAMTNWMKQVARPGAVGSGRPQAQGQPPGRVRRQVAELLQVRIGLKAEVLGERAIDRAIDERCRSLGLDDAGAYPERLAQSEAELTELTERVVVPETWFFRDREPFALLRGALAARRDRPVRILSLPCCTGEEPYSIAMALLDDGWQPERLHIDAYDISHHAIEVARAGIYRPRSFRGEVGSWQGRHFTSLPDGTRQIDEAVQSRVQFRQGNVLDVATLAGRQYDAIFCRNLLIYFDAVARSRVLQTLDQSLRADGLLFVGSAETGHIAGERWQRIRHPFAFAFRKPLAIAPVIAPPSPPAPVRPLAPVPSSRRPVAPVPQPARRSAEGRDIDEPPARAFAPLAAAKALADRGQLAQALRHCQAHVATVPTDVPARVLLGEVYQAFGDRAQAAACFRQALYLQPRCYEALVHLMHLAEARGDRDRADQFRQRLQRSHRPFST